MNNTESIQLISVQPETKLITHDDIIPEIIRVGIASAAWMPPLLSKRSPWQRELRELREIVRRGGIIICHRKMREIVLDVPLAVCRPICRVRADSSTQELVQNHHFYSQKRFPPLGRDLCRLWAYISSKRRKFQLFGNL